MCFIRPGGYAVVAVRAGRIICINSWTRARRNAVLALPLSMPRHRARAWAASYNTCSTELRSMVHLGRGLLSTAEPIGIELELPELGRRSNPEWLADTSRNDGRGCPTATTAGRGHPWGKGCIVTVMTVVFSPPCVLTTEVLSIRRTTPSARPTL